MHGFVTLPAEEGQEEAMLTLIQKWGADAIRDSDGTRLSDKITQLATLFTQRFVSFAQTRPGLGSIETS